MSEDNCGDGSGGFKAGNKCATRGTSARKFDADFARGKRREELKKIGFARPRAELKAVAERLKKRAADTGQSMLDRRAGLSAERALSVWRDKQAKAGKPTGDDWKADPDSIGSHAKVLGGTEYELTPHHSAFEAIHSVHGDGPLPPVGIDTVSHFDGGKQGQYNSGDTSVTVARNGVHPVATAVHEYGHYLDHHGLGDAGEGFASDRSHDDTRALLNEIYNSPEAAQLNAAHDDADADVRRHLGYLMQGHELFARAYTQYIAHKSGHPALTAALAEEAPTHVGKMSQWSKESFAPIAARFDEMFAKKGWLR